MSSRRTNDGPVREARANLTRRAGGLTGRIYGPPCGPGTSVRGRTVEPLYPAEFAIFGVQDRIFIGSTNFSERSAGQPGRCLQVAAYAARSR